MGPTRLRPPARLRSKRLHLLGVSAANVLALVSAPAAFAQSSSAAPSQPGTAPVDANSPAIHAGPVTILFGGFTELAAIYRNRNQTADVGSNFNTAIPFPSSQQYDISEFRMSARQSRFSMLVQGDPYAGATAESYLEADFLGAAPTANSNESNSYNLRIRQFYGLFATDSGFSLVAGEMWSLVTLEKKGMNPRDENIPLTIDAQYVPGFNWTRNAELRLVKDFNHKFALGLSVESPEALLGTNNNVPSAPQTIAGTTDTVTLNPYPKNVVVSNPGGSLYSATNNYSIDVAPDVILKGALDPGFGHYELYGIARWFRSNIGGVNNTVSGGGVGGGLILPIIPSNVLNFQASGLGGKGVGRYGSAQLPDVVVQPTGDLSTIKEYMALAGVTSVPTPDLTLYAYAGREQISANYVNATITTGGATFGPYAYGYGSPLYDVSGCYTLGGKCQANTRRIDQVTGGFWWKYYHGVLGNLQFGVQVSYTQRNSFAGIGGEPVTGMLIGMASFRYYPFQK
jgi:hypothetical protein